ncbi:hypothetical protein [Mobiluncus curtisii]|nr:hypothetical protein [Mobiluncus curtisii]
MLYPAHTASGAIIDQLHKGGARRFHVPEVHPIRKTVVAQMFWIRVRDSKNQLKESPEEVPVKELRAKTANIILRREPEIKPEADKLFSSFRIPVADAINIFPRTYHYGRWVSATRLHNIMQVEAYWGTKIVKLRYYPFPVI